LPDMPQPADDYFSSSFTAALAFPKSICPA
jgi:hypothetical protein